MKCLSHPLPSDVEPVYIFGTNFDVDFYNHVKLDAMAGHAKIYKLEDEGTDN